MMTKSTVDEIQVFPVPKLTEQRDRITAQLNVYHEQWGEDPTQVACSFEGSLSRATEEVYSRKILVLSEDWSELDLGWLKGHKVSLIVLENREGRRITTNLTDDQKIDLSQQVLQVGVRIDGGVQSVGLVRPGRFMVFEPDDPAEIRVRSARRPLKAMVHVIPG